MCPLSPGLATAGCRIPLDHFNQLPTICSIHFRLRHTLEYVRCNLGGNLSLSRLAMAGNTSVWHICRLFKSELGISPARYIKLLRLKCAADLLATTSLSV